MPHQKITESIGDYKIAYQLRLSGKHEFLFLYVYNMANEVVYQDCLFAKPRKRN